MTDTTSFLLVLLAAAAAPFIAAGASRIHPHVIVPIVVVELFLGALIGPDVLGLAEMDNILDFLGAARARLPLLLRGLRDRARQDPGDAAAAGRLGWVITLVLAYAHRGRADGARRRALGPARRLGDVDDGARHAPPGPARRRAARDAARALRARGRRRRRVRPGADRHGAARLAVRPVDAAAPARDLRRCWRCWPRRSSRCAPSGAGWELHRAQHGDERPGPRAPHRAAALRARRGRRRPRPRRDPRRVRGGRDPAAARAGTRGECCSSPSSTRSASAC